MKNKTKKVKIEVEPTIDGLKYTIAKLQKYLTKIEEAVEATDFFDERLK